jgi:hypothetical protein
MKTSMKGDRRRQRGRRVEVRGNWGLVCVGRCKVENQALMLAAARCGDGMSPPDAGFGEGLEWAGAPKALNHCDPTSQDAAHSLQRDKRRKKRERKGGWWFVQRSPADTAVRVTVCHGPAAADPRDAAPRVGQRGCDSVRHCSEWQLDLPACRAAVHPLVPLLLRLGIPEVTED